MPPPDALACLDRTERQRAERFRFAAHARRHLASHVALRQVLAAVTGHQPASLVWVHSPDGKPGLHLPQPLHFNMAHSDDLALIALSATRPMGVDLEYPGRSLNDEALAHQTLDANELAQWQHLPDEARSDALLRIWTRKEACLKALGVGLRMAPSQVPVGFGPHTRALTLLHEGRPQPLFVRNIALPRPLPAGTDKAVAALAVCG